MEKARLQQESEVAGLPLAGEGAEICPAYTDDVTMAVAREKTPELVRAAREEGRQVEAPLLELTLALGRPKCNNLVLSLGGHGRKDVPPRQRAVGHSKQ